jgi:signal transduction histidine kinase/CheY-like chemotaxis protein
MPPTSASARLAAWLSSREPGPDAAQESSSRLTDELARCRGELERARRDADTAVATRREFLAAMNHELRTPLNAILGFAQVLELSGLTADQRQSVSHVLKGGRHLLQLINELLDISQLDSGNLDLSPEPVALDELVAEVGDLMLPAAVERAITIDLPPPTRLWVVADRHRLKQVLLNLLSNAIKFNRPEGRISVRAAAVDHHRVRLGVTDTGPGLSSDQVARLFAPFERLDASTRGIEGTGLGLTLCRGLVRRMKGNIGVDSARGEGATFWVELPATAELVSSTAWDARPSPVRPSLAGPNRGMVLHIEDNSSNLRLMERILATRPGLRVLPAIQGRLGLALAKEHQPELILLDLNLPDTHGLDVLRRLAEDRETASIPVIVVTADASPGQIRRAEALGARAVVSKPIDVQRLLAIVDATLGRRNDR